MNKIPWITDIADAHVVALTILSLVLITAFVGTISDRNMHLFIDLANWIIKVAIGQNIEGSEKSEAQALEKEGEERLAQQRIKSNLILCRYCLQPVKAHRIRDHNKKCPRNSRSKLRKGNTPFG